MIQRTCLSLRHFLFSQLLDAFIVIACLYKTTISSDDFQLKLRMHILACRHWIW